MQFKEQFLVDTMSSTHSTQNSSLQIKKKQCVTHATIVEDALRECDMSNVGIAIINHPPNHHFYGWYKPSNMGGLLLLYPHEVGKSRQIYGYSRWKVSPWTSMTFAEDKNWVIADDQT